MEAKAYSVYCHTNKVNGKKYIGITSVPVKVRWKKGSAYKGSPKFFNAINKYGWDGFEHEVLFSGLTLEEANAKEIELIAKYDSTCDKHGYNLSLGGSNPAHTDVIRAKIVATWDKDPERRKKFSDRMKALRQDPKYSEQFRLNPYRPCSDETKIKIGNANKGRKHTEEELSKMRKAFSGAKNPAARAVVCLETGIEYATAREAAQLTGANSAKICEVCRNKRHTSGGYHWKYKD